MPPIPRPKKLTGYFVLALVCAGVVAVLLLGYFGACAGLVPGDDGGKKSAWALVFVAVFGTVGLWAWSKRYTRMS